jgi:hypothetical protein
MKLLCNEKIDQIELSSDFDDFHVFCSKDIKLF